MHRLLNILLPCLLTWQLALAGAVCGCSESDDHHEQDSGAVEHVASLDSSQQHVDAVTALCGHCHRGEDECDHAAHGTAESPLSTRPGKSPTPAAPALTCRPDTPLYARTAIDAPLTAGRCDPGSHWLVSIRSVVLHL